MSRQTLFLAAYMQIEMDAFGVLGLDLVNRRWCKPSSGYLKLNVEESFWDNKVAYEVYYVRKIGMGFCGVF